ncbi:thioesterase domain-containing protein [Shewanella mesophila]|uniref:thioesterase domain-containing protein n=1 Tax=Shewanella mesophila TaxID=2864208 RepID=UPI001C659F93|nr:thioesterase domain-containing protein [Shewanella mesophila]QYJ85913.1 thioesterase domain-containing protein [Shewanella mesophila]
MTSKISILLEQLGNTWHQTIPVSEFMQICPESYLQHVFSVSAPLAPNINLHHTMFAGSIYTLMTLTGWGAVWLNQQLTGVKGDIVLANAHIRYLAPITTSPTAKVTWPGDDLSALSAGRRVKVNLSVELYCEGKRCAEFEGTYVSLPSL